MAGSSKPMKNITGILIGLVFTLSGFLKILEPGQFLFDVQAFEAVPYPIAYGVALFLPWLEVFAGLNLIALKWIPHKGASVILALMTAAFIVLITWADVRGLDLDCGCFGDWLVFPNTLAHIGFNCLLLAGLSWISISSGKSPSLDTPARQDEKMA